MNSQHDLESSRTQIRSWQPQHHYLETSCFIHPLNSASYHREIAWDLGRMSCRPNSLVHLHHYRECSRINLKTSVFWVIKFILSVKYTCAAKIVQPIFALWLWYRERLIESWGRAKWTNCNFLEMHRWRNRYWLSQIWLLSSQLKPKWLILLK